VGDKLLLKQGDLAIATMVVESKFRPQKPLECLKCYGTSSIEHPGVVRMQTLSFSFIFPVLLCFAVLGVSVF